MRVVGRIPVGRPRPHCSSTVTHGGEAPIGEAEAASLRRRRRRRRRSRPQV
jgi:hypothetical protein